MMVISCVTSQNLKWETEDKIRSFFLNIQETFQNLLKWSLSVLPTRPKYVLNIEDIGRILFSFVMSSIYPELPHS